jgi:hypothetical protein
MFDTGSEGVGLFPGAAARLRLQIDVPVPTNSLTNGKVAVGMTKPYDLKVAGASLKTRFGIWPHSLNPYEEQFDGMIGWPSVRSNTMIIEASTVTLKFTKQIAEEAAKWTKYHALANGGILALEIPGPASNKMIVTIDTGAPTGIALSRQRWEEWKAAHPLRPRTLISYFMMGAGNHIQEESWADEITLGSLVLT